MKPGWRELIFIVMLGMVPLGAWAYINLPRERAKKRMDSEHTELVRMISVTTGVKGPASRSVNKTNERLQRLLGASTKHLREDFDIARAKSDVRQLAVENNLQPGFIDRGGPHPLPGTKMFLAYTFKLVKIKGRYEDFKRFLERLPGQGYRIWIPNAMVSRSGGGGRVPKPGEVVEDIIEAELEIKILVPTETNNSKGKGNERGKQQPVSAPMADEFRSTGPRTSIE